MSQLLVGANLIVRDEAETLVRCLESIRPFIDELIVVDTGSTDGTADIARTYGATVVTAEWEEDFAKARNIALSHTSAEWVLIIDADEAVAGGAENLRELLRHTKADALTVEIGNPYGHRPWERVTFRPVRLFRRGAPHHYRFQGRLHEQIVSVTGEGIPAAKTEPSPLKLIHDGYLPERMKAGQKVRRNLNILTQMVKDAPDDPFILYNLGVTHCQLGQPEEAVRFFAAACDHAPPQAPYRPTLIRDNAKALIQLGRWEEIIELLQRETGKYSDYPDLHHMLGEAMAGAGRWLEAREAYSKALECPANPGVYVTEPGMGGFRTVCALGDLARKMGALEEAVQCYEKCATLEPRFEPGLLGWADTLELMGTPLEEIRDRLTAAVKPRDTERRLLLAGIFTRLGLHTEALSLIDSDWPAAREMRRECLMQTGRFKEVLAWLDDESVAALLMKNREAAMDVALCFWNEERPLPYRFYKHLPTDEQAAYEAADRYVTEGKKCEALQSDPAVRNLTAGLIGRAVRRKLMRLAEKLSRISADCAIELGLSLYRHGFVLPAADRLLLLMKEGHLSVKGLYVLGEIVYDKGHYSQAAALFEDVLAKDGAHYRARIGASLCYLHLARELLLESLQKAPHHPAFHQDLKRIETSIALLEAADWHTAWSASERRNMHAAPEDLFVHDCEG